VPFKAFLAADHVTPAGAGLTIPVQVSKNGGEFAGLATPANATSIGSGWYYVDLAVADTGTLGPLIVRGTEATIDPAEIVYEVVPATNAGFSSTPNAAADAPGGLPISDAGGLDMDSLVPTGAGTGAFTVAVTVKDEADTPLENVTVRYTTGVDTYTNTTNVDGVAVFNLDNATYVVAATRAGYFYAGTEHVVTDDDTLVIEMATVVVPTPEDPGQTMGHGVARDSQGIAESGVVVSFKLLSPTTGGQYAHGYISVTSGADGTYQILLVKNATYQMRRAGGPASWEPFTTTAADTFELPVI